MALLPVRALRDARHQRGGAVRAVPARYEGVGGGIGRGTVRQRAKKGMTR